MAFALNRPMTIFMVALALVFFGLRSLNRLDTALLPAVDSPDFVIVTEYADRTAEEIERTITIPLEDNLSSLKGLQGMSSYSRAGVSIIKCHFQWGGDRRYTLLRIRERVDALFDRLPPGARRPYILDGHPAGKPVMELVLQGAVSLSELAGFTRDVLVPRFSQIPGIASTRIHGLPEQALQIVVRSPALMKQGITYVTVLNSLRDNLFQRDLSLTVQSGQIQIPLTVKFPVGKETALLDLPLNDPSGLPIKLSSLATVAVNPLPARTLVFVDTTQTLQIDLIREFNVNTLSATREARTLIRDLSMEYPEFRIRIINDRGGGVRLAMTNLKQALTLGASLAFLVILLFLRNFRYALMLVIAIPSSLLFTFNMLYLHHITLNLMTLGGMALAVGLIVDNGIIVVESIFNAIEHERSVSAVYRGVKQVSRPLAGSTLTTVAIFLPIIYMEGYVSILFMQQALTVSYTLIIALVSALTLFPAGFRYFVLNDISDRDTLTQGHSLASMNRTLSFSKRAQADGKDIRSAHFRWLPLFIRVFCSTFDGMLQRAGRQMETLYHRLLVQILDNKFRILGALALLVSVSLISFMYLPRRTWPLVESSTVEISAAVSDGIPMDKVKRQVLTSVNNLLRLNDVVSVVTHIVDNRGSNLGIQAVVLNPPGLTHVMMRLFLRNPVRESLFDPGNYSSEIVLDHEDLSIRLSRPLNADILFAPRRNIQIYVSGKDKHQAIVLADSCLRFIRSLPQVRESYLDSGGYQPVMMFRLRPQSMGTFNVSPQQVITNLRYGITGEKIGEWVQGIYSIPVIVFLDSTDVKDWMSVYRAVNAPGESLFRNEHLVSIATGERPLEKRRQDRKNVTVVEARAAPRDLQDVISQVQTWAETRQVTGIELFITGESEELSRAHRSMVQAFLMSVLLVYLILVAQFESWIHPLNILLTVPMGLCGVSLSLFVFQHSLNVVSLIGAVMLVGIGVNDAIIKIDCMDRYRRLGNRSLREAVVRGSQEKFRPVVMTSVTTLAAMLPMALGIGGGHAMSRSLAITIIGGLTVTTLLTLFLTPVIYESSEKLKARLAAGESRSIHNRDERY